MLKRKLYFLKKHRDICYAVVTSLFLFGLWYRLFVYDPTTCRDYMIKNFKDLERIVQEDKGMGCEIPKLNPFEPSVMRFVIEMPKIECEGTDWVRCYLSKCKVNPTLLELVGDEFECTYRDIIYVHDESYYLGPPVTLKGNHEYVLNKSDHVKINCKLTNVDYDTITTNKQSREGIWPLHGVSGSSWIGHGIGFRPVKPRKPPAGRENTFNVLIFAFDAASKNGFIRKMPKSVKFLTEELGAVMLQKYNIVASGTPGTLFPLLTGRTEAELPSVAKTRFNRRFVDTFPFIYYKLREDGYRTAHFEDSPWIGTFNFRFNGFRQQPTDHFLRAVFLEESKHNTQKFCIGDTPRFKIMMNITDQFIKMDGKRFCFTIVADISHDVFNWITNADEPFVDFLKGLQRANVLKNTLLIAMGDHGQVHGDVRRTTQGKFEERLPFMAIRLPDEMLARRPDALKYLKSNVDTLTTPHDVHATVLDVLDMREHWNPFKVPGADLLRGMTLLEPIPKTRSCGEAGIGVYWCTCLEWRSVKPEDPLYKQTGLALLNFMNEITESQRSKCAVRTLKSIDWAIRKKPSVAMTRLLNIIRDSKDQAQREWAKGLINDTYQVQITVGPGLGVYQAIVMHRVKENTFHVNTTEVSRVNAYTSEPACISTWYPHLLKYCYCKTHQRWL